MDDRLGGGEVDVGWRGFTLAAYPGRFPGVGGGGQAPGQRPQLGRGIELAVTRISYRLKLATCVASLLVTAKVVVTLAVIFVPLLPQCAGISHGFSVVASPQMTVSMYAGLRSHGV